MHAPRSILLLAAAAASALLASGADAASIAARAPDAGSSSSGSQVRLPKKFKLFVNGADADMGMTGTGERVGNSYPHATRGRTFTALHSEDDSGLVALRDTTTGLYLMGESLRSDPHVSHSKGGARLYYGDMADSVAGPSSSTVGPAGYPASAFIFKPRHRKGKKASGSGKRDEQNHDEHKHADLALAWQNPDGSVATFGHWLEFTNEPSSGVALPAPGHDVVAFTRDEHYLQRWPKTDKYSFGVPMHDA